MKILISVLPSVFNTDGTTIQARRISKALSKKHEVKIVTRCKEKYNNHNFENIPLICIKPKNTIFWNFKLLRIIFKEKFDIVYCSNDWYGFFSYYIFSNLLNYKIIFEAHDTFSGKSNNRCNRKNFLRKILENFVTKKADILISLSKQVFISYKKKNKNIELIPVFKDENVYKKKDKINMEKQYNNMKKYLGLIGPFNNKRNNLHLHFLYNNLEKFDDQIHFLIIGECKNRIDSNKVTYTGYLNSLEDYINILSSLDAVLIPEEISTNGPLNKILEPMFCSLPVFTTPQGFKGLHGIIPGKDILLLEKKQLVNKINELVFDSENLKKIGENARKTVLKHYGKESNEKKVLTLIESIR